MKETLFKGADMEAKKNLIVLIVLIVILSAIASFVGINSSEGQGEYQITSIRDRDVLIYGKGLYQDMSSDVAIQGIAQDYVTFFIAIPLLLLATAFAIKGSQKAKIYLTGIVAYFFVTYLFYMSMAMFNYLFLVYAALLALSFYTLIRLLLSFDIKVLRESYQDEKALKFSARFLIFNVVMIALLWLSVIIPPLLDGRIYPPELQHYTTLIVQGMDLGLLLPICLISAILLLKKKDLGYICVPVYSVFLSVLMTALTAKLIAMGLQGQQIIPAIIFIPLFALISMRNSIAMISKIQD